MKEPFLSRGTKTLSESLLDRNKTFEMPIPIQQNIHLVHRRCFPRPSGMRGVKTIFGETLIEKFVPSHCQTCINLPTLGAWEVASCLLFWSYRPSNNIGFHQLAETDEQKSSSQSFTVKYGWKIQHDKTNIHLFTIYNIQCKSYIYIIHYTMYIMYYYKKKLPS